MVRRIVIGFLLLCAPVRAESPPLRLPEVPGPWAALPKRVRAALDTPRLDFIAPHPDDSTKCSERALPKLELRTKVKDCCGYPLGERGQFKMTFYWLAWECDYANEPYLVDVYTRQGFAIGRFPRTFVFELKLEGSAMLRDGRALNYDGHCRYGIGICFQTLDPTVHPLGKGGQGRALEPFRSVAVDPRFVPLGTPLYIPELAGLRMPDGTPHDGCVRADDTGGGIRRHELDFFVESYPNYKFIDDQFWGNGHVTPHVEEPRCAYLRSGDAVLDRRSEATDWTELEARRPPPPPPPAKKKHAKHQHKKKS
jgi:3D (Asp-Asp-Asp) domain-containing protein